MRCLDLGRDVDVLQALDLERELVKEGCHGDRCGRKVVTEPGRLSRAVYPLAVVVVDDANRRARCGSGLSKQHIQECVWCTSEGHWAGAQCRVGQGSCSIGAVLERRARAGVTVVFFSMLKGPDSGYYFRFVAQRQYEAALSPGFFGTRRGQVAGERARRLTWVAGPAERSQSAET